MRKMLEIQVFLEYSMDVIDTMRDITPVLCANFLQYSKIVPNFIAGGLITWTVFCARIYRLLVRNISVHGLCSRGYLGFA